MLKWTQKIFFFLGGGRDLRFVWVFFSNSNICICVGLYIFYPVGCHFQPELTGVKHFLHLIGNLFVFFANYFFPTTTGTEQKQKRFGDCNYCKCRVKI
jgi:hypothetical protein